MAEDVLDEMYWVKPEEFTARRSRLAQAAKDRGETAVAKQISACRRPTTAAWVVNRLALSHAKTPKRLTDLRDQLRAAHSAMDGDRIRELSTEQRTLIDQLATAAFDAAELTDPSAALRDDVTATLHAAIADPEVTARLGRLTKAERWSGFGGFGDAAAAEVEQPRRRKRTQRAKAALAAAEQAKVEADQALAERDADAVEARAHRDDAERMLKRAEKAYAKAEQAARNAAEAVKEAAAQVEQSDLDDSGD
jgi:chromosome segregation ATPase